MIKIENVEVAGWESAIRGCRNPLNSWKKSDSFKCDVDDCQFAKCPHYYTDGGYSECGKHRHSNLIHENYIIGNNDLTLMKKLAKAGTDHRKFMRMIVVYMDVTAPMYWWSEADTYKVGTVRNSCSKMYTIHKKEFTLDDFSHENLNEVSMEILYDLIERLNCARKLYLSTNEKEHWWQIIQLLPSSYNQKATLMLNYEVLANMYHSRKNHKLTEWRTLCEWIKTLPYSELVTGGDE